MNKTFNDPNLKYSDQLTPLAQMADFEGGSSDIPTPTVADAGKVLTVGETGAYELGDVDALPAISAGDAGKVLTVNAGETAAEWAAASGGGAAPVIIDIIETSGAGTVRRTLQASYNTIQSYITQGKSVISKFESVYTEGGLTQTDVKYYPLSGYGTQTVISDPPDPYDGTQYGVTFGFDSFQATDPDVYMYTDIES